MDSGVSVAICGLRRFGERTMKRVSLIVLFFLLVPSFPISAEGNHKHLYLPDALPLGLDPDATYERTAFRLAVGDRLTFYTDGLLEARNAEGEMRHLSTADLHIVTIQGRMAY
jgi:hypothetical protein